MGLFDKLKEKVSETTGIDVDSTLEAAGSATDATESLADAADSFGEAKDKLTGN